MWQSPFLTLNFTTGQFRFTAFAFFSSHKPTPTPQPRQLQDQYIPHTRSKPPDGLSCIIGPIPDLLLLCGFYSAASKTDLLFNWRGFYSLRRPWAIENNIQAMNSDSTAMEDPRRNVEVEMAHESSDYHYNGDNLKSCEGNHYQGPPIEFEPPPRFTMKKAKRKDDRPWDIVCSWVVEHQIGTSPCPLYPRQNHS